MKKSKNPKLKEGDRIILVYMDGESLDPGKRSCNWVRKGP